VKFPGSCFLSRRTIAIALPLSFAIGSAIGCSSSGGSSTGFPGSPYSGNTSVTLLATGTANDQLSRFGITFSSITLSGAAGLTTTIPASALGPNFIEFMHLNGAAEPIVTANIPQGVYTSATVNIASAGFVCVAQSAGTLYIDNLLGRSASPTITFPAPITITGTAMALSLNLLVSQSYTLDNCTGSPTNVSTFTPTFTMAPVTIAASPTNINNGKLAGLSGIITASNAGGSNLTITSPDGPVWSVKYNSNTLLQGATSLSSLTAGMPVTLDVALQPDGSELATRLSVLDTNTTNLNYSYGPLNFVSNVNSNLFGIGQQAEGVLITNEVPYSVQSFNTSGATFQVSSQLPNLSTLPFTASVTPTNIVPGQNLLFTWHSATFGSGYPITSTATLVPQTINGKVISTSGTGGFQIYTISLAPYDMPTQLASQSGQATLIQNPSTVQVYVDTTTQMLNATPLAVGSLFRFNGLLFNNNGSFAMDAGTVLDGVPE
jgi:hypothetical protein